MINAVRRALSSPSTNHSSGGKLLMNSTSCNTKTMSLESACATWRVLKLAVAVAVVASVLTVARPNQGAVSIPLFDGVADAVSAAIAKADHQSTCTTTWVTRYTYNGYPYRASVTTCTPIPHPPPRESLDWGEGLKAGGYAGAALFTTAIGCLGCGAAIGTVAILDAFIPDSWADRNPTCNPAETGIAYCGR